MKEVLKLEHIQKYYGTDGNITKAIDDISFSVYEGEFVGIMGASGSGKTTMLNCISTIDTVSAGHIYLDGKDVTEIGEKEIARFRREKLGFVFQDYNLLDALTVSENIALALTINQVSAGDIDRRIHEIATGLNISEILDKYPYEVFGGERQRCACARAVVNAPKLILMDEPTGALDSHSARMLLGTMQEMNKHLKATILMVTHDAFSASFLLIIIRKCKRWKNRNVNAVLLGSLFQKVSSTANTLSISTLAITVSMIAFVVMPILAEIATGYLDYRMPYDIMINNSYSYIDKMEDIPHIDFTFIGDILKKYGITLSEELQQESYFIWERDFNTADSREHWRDLPRLAMGLSDYNDMRKMAGVETIELENDQFFMHIDYEMDKESIEKSINTTQIQLDDGTVLTLADISVRNEPLGEYLFNMDGSVLVFPDTICQNLHLARTCYYANTENEIPYTLCDTIREEILEYFQERHSYLYDIYEEKYQNSKNYIGFIEPIRFRTQENSDVTLTATSIRLLGIYVGVVFFIVCMTILALQSITDCIDHRIQYRNLYWMGVEERDILKIAGKQSFLYFFTPCVAAFFIALALIYSFAVRYGHKIFTYMSSMGVRFGILIPGVLIVMILACYYSAAVYMMKKNLMYAFTLRK